MKRLTLFSVSFLLAGCAEQAMVGPTAVGPGQSAGFALFGPKPITTAGLLDDLTSLRRLAELSNPAYVTKQFSSYDRASKTSADYKGWFANGDWGQYIRVEEKPDRREYVMMDAEGPGAVVRIWSANPKGRIRIYIDGAPEPVILTEMETLLGGKYPGLPRPIAGEYSKGWNLYFPIPYAKHCKVTSDAGDFYYHVNYRTYPAGTKVESFAAAEIEQLGPQIKAIGEALSNPRGISVPKDQRENKAFDVAATGGESATIAELNGAKAICALSVQITADDVPAALRAVVLEMTFDGEGTVSCPLGDFFGTAPGLNEYASLPLGITGGKNPELWSHWWMPFAKNAKITIRNLSDAKVHVTGSIATVPYKWTERSLHFNAGWRTERDVPSRPWTDWTHLEASGDGRFVGGALHIINTVRGWWGEGDEKIYVDGEKFPSHFGTGTEDYYGYAWCWPGKFVHAYHNQPLCQGPGNYGNTSVNRFHIIDDIPFTKSIKFDIENWHGVDSPKAKTTRAAVSYWYARPGGSSAFKKITRADVKLVNVPEYKVLIVPGAQEGEKLKVLKKTGVADRQGLSEQFSDEAQLWWRNAKPGDKLTVAFKSPAEGSRHVIVRLTKAPDYGKVQLSVNGKKAGEAIDLYAKGVEPAAELDLGAMELKKGENTLTAEIVGANDAAIKGYMFGLDYLVVK
jgi:hypothetical protein